MDITENISLAGYSFKVRSDAYRKLEEYLDSVKDCFQSDGEEIMLDIEERIAEILKERCPEGMVVDMAMVDDMISRMGNPEDYAECAEENVAPQRQEDRYQGKRLYRNIDERVIGGVCSGLGAYFNVDKVIFRLAFIALFCLGFIGCRIESFFIIASFIYIALWIATPAARTVEQRCRMNGKPMDLGAFKTTGGRDFSLSREARDFASSRSVRNVGRTVLGIVMMVIGLGGMIGCIFLPSVPNFLTSMATISSLHFGIGDLSSGPEAFVWMLVTGNLFWYFVTVIVCTLCIWFLYNGVMFSFNLKSPSWKPGLVIFIFWIVSILAFAAWIAKNVADSLPMFVA